MVKIVSKESDHCFFSFSLNLMSPYHGRGSLNKNKKVLLLLGFSELMDNLTNGIVPFYQCLLKF